jgi:hypothetical protein
MWRRREAPLAPAERTANARSDRAAAIDRGRRAEGRAQHTRYYALNDHPNYRAFGKPDYVDEQGRYYRLARPMPPLPGNLLTLWVKLPKRTVPWFAGGVGAPALVTLRGNDKRTRSVHIVNAYLMQASHRTGHVHVSAAEWAQ